MDATKHDWRTISDNGRSWSQRLFCLVTLLNSPVRSCYDLVNWIIIYSPNNEAGLVHRFLTIMTLLVHPIKPLQNVQPRDEGINKTRACALKPAFSLSSLGETFKG